MVDMSNLAFQGKVL